MKKIFKLAAIAVSMALVAGLVACSSGDDDVVDASTPKYLVAKQIAQYVDSIEYNQNVSDDEIKSLKTAHDEVMKIIDDCADCLDAYFGQLENECTGWGYWVDDDSEKHWYSYKKTLGSNDIESLVKELKYLKRYGTEKDYHKVYVYKPAVEDALEELVWFEKYGDEYRVSKSSDARRDVLNIGNPEGDTSNTIRDGKLNDRQAASMKAYTDAYDALKAALNETDSKTYKAKFKDVDDKIKAFNDLNKDVKEKEIGKVTKTKIEEVTDAVDGICKDIQINVYATILYLAR